MKITSIEVANFRSFGPNGINFLFDEGVNIIVGENNTGKSNLIHALETIRDLIASDPPNALTIKTFHREEKEAPITFRMKAIMDEWDISSLMTALQLSVRDKDDFLTLFGEELSLDLEYFFDNNRLVRKRFHVGKMQIEDGKGVPVGADPQQYKSSRGWQEYVSAAKAGKTIASQLEEYPNRTIQFGNNIDRVIGSFLVQRSLIIPEYREQPRSSEISIVPKTALTGKDLPSALHSLANSEKWKSFETIQKKFFDLFSISLRVTNKPEIIFTGRNEVSHESVGAGVITVLIMLTHLIGFKGNVFFIDEPELHLHPHSKRMLLL